MSSSIGALGLGNPFANFPNRPKVTVAGCHFVNDLDCAATVWTQGGTGSQVDFSTVTDEVGGAVIATTVASGHAQGDFAAAQYISEQFKLSLGAEILFLARFQIYGEDAAVQSTNAQMFIGLAKTTSDSAVLGGTSGTGNLATDIIGFWKDDGDLNIDLVYGMNVVTSNANYTRAASAIGTLADATYKDYAFRVLMDPTTAGTGVLQSWLDGVKTSEATFTDLPYDEELALTMGVASGATHASKERGYKCDLIYALQRAA